MSNIEQKSLSIAKNLTAAFSLPIFAGAGASLKIFSEFEKGVIALERVEGSAEKASEKMDELFSIANRDGFRVKGLLQAQQTLNGFGLSSEAATTTVNVLSESMLALGKSDADLQGVVLAMGQIAAKGKISTEEVLQLAERGVPAFAILKEQLNLSAQQMANLGNAGISAQDGIAAILRGLSERSAGASEAFTNSFNVAFTRLLNQTELAFAKVGGIISNGMNLPSILNDIGNFVNNAVNAFDSLGPGVQSALVGFTLIAALIPPAVVAIITFQKALRTVTPLMRTFGSTASKAMLRFAIVPTLIFAAIIALKSLYDAFEGVRDIVGGVIDFVTTQFQNLVGVINEVATYIGEAFDINLGGAFDGVKKTINDILDSDPVSKFTDAFQKNLQGVGDYISDIYDQLTAGSDTGAKSVEDAVANIENALAGLGGAGESAKNGIISQLESQVKSLKDSLKGLSSETEIAAVNDQIRSVGSELERLKELSNVAVTFDLSGFEAFKAELDLVDEIFEDTFDDEALNREIDIAVNAQVSESLGLVPAQLDQASLSAEQATAALRRLASDGLTALGEALGGVIAGEGSYSFLDTLITYLAGAAQQIGAILIGMGTAKLSFDTLFVNPIGAIAAGVALVALGAAAKKAFTSVGSGNSGTVGSFGGGGSIGGRFNSGGNTQQPVYVEGRISGESILLSGQRTSSRKTALYDA